MDNNGPNGTEVDRSVDDSTGSAAESSSTVSRSELEEEDRELIEENLGSIGFRRLQQRNAMKSDAQEEEKPETEDEDEEEMSIIRKRVAPEELERLFAEEDEEGTTEKFNRHAKYEDLKEEFEESEEDELDDFIEEDEDETEKSSMVSTATKASVSSRAYLAEAFGVHLPSRFIKDILEIFGDGTDYLGLVDDDIDDYNDDNDYKEELSREKVDHLEKKRLLGPVKGLVDHESPVIKTDLPESLIRRDGINRSGPEEGELELEASWIISRWYQDRLTSERFQTVDQSALIVVVTAVLRLFREQFLEVPTVATHRKEVFQHFLGLNDLWSIWDWDEQWKILHQQRTIAKHQLDDEVVAGTNEKDILSNVLNAADSIEVVEVVSDYVKELKKRKPSSIEGLIREFADSFTIDMTAFVNNLNKQQVIHHPPTPTQDLRGLISSIGLGEQQTINALVANIASYIGRHPYGHLSLKTILERIAAISVTPTERGRIEIDVQHELASVKYITAKPIMAFVEDQFLLLVKGHSIGLLNYKVIFPQLEENINHLAKLYGCDGEEDSEWDRLRRRALTKAINDFIIPKSKREIIAKLRTAAERWLAIAGQYVLQDKLMVAPYDPSRAKHPKHSGTGFRIMAVSWGDGEINAITFAIIADEKGRILEQARIPRLHEKHRANNTEEWDKLISLITEYEPSCVLVAGRNIFTKDLFYDIEKEIERSKTIKNSPIVLYGDDDTAKLYCDSARGKREWPDSPSIMRYCISLARRWLCPLFELCDLSDNELLAIDNNPIAQLVPRETRLKYLHLACINVVNLVGIDINQAVAFTWMRSPLKYVCGLGPMKAERLVKNIANTVSSRMQSRSELSEVVGPRVFSNCASFLRISPGGKKGTVDPLDDTRIHPENYALARKMAADAMEMSLEDEIEGENIAMTAVIKVMQQPTRLDDLLLDEYAKELIKRGQPSKHLTLFDIKAELQRPYADLRTFVKGPSVECIFEMLTRENERTLWIGASVRAIVVRVADRNAICQLPSRLTAILPERGERYKIGQVVLAKVVAIHLDKFEVDIVELRADEAGESRFAYDQYYDYEQAKKDRDLKQREMNPVKTKLVRRRMIAHPAWRDVSRQEAEEILRDALLGEVVLRPSGSKGSDHLSLTWKIDDDHGRVALFQHLDIIERDRSSNSALGRILYIGNESFEDLDEIIARFVEPIAAYLRDVRSTPKYFPINTINKLEARTMIEHHLLEERSREPARIAYCLSLSRDRPGNVVLSYQPANKSYHELVDVTPAGFVLRGQRFESIEQMVTWFKQNYRSTTDQTPKRMGLEPSGRESERYIASSRSKDEHRDRSYYRR